eukprot:5769520-Amphidinium_carterae.1
MMHAQASARLGHPDAWMHDQKSWCYSTQPTCCMMTGYGGSEHKETRNIAQLACRVHHTITKATVHQPKDCLIGFLPDVKVQGAQACSALCDPAGRRMGTVPRKHVQHQSLHQAGVKD